MRNRIDFGMTHYANSYSMGRAWIRIDEKEILNMSTPEFYAAYYSHLTEQGKALKTKELHDNNVFSSYNFGSALFDYLNMATEKILESDNAIIRAFGMLDARVGKRRLKKVNPSKEHDLVRQLYYLRCDAEGFLDSNGSIDLSSRLTNPYRGSRDNRNEGDTQKAIRKLANSKKMRNLKVLINQIYNDELTKDELETELGKTIFEGFLGVRDREGIYEALKFFDAKTKFCDDPAYIKASIAMVEDTANCVRPLKQWRPKTYNMKKQFASLARHLWAQYDVPVFMDKAWLGGSSVQQQWYKDIGSGKNIRNSENLPISLTKMMAHHFLLAPDNYSIEGALRWGQVHALGGDKRLADALLETRIVEDFRDDDFWLSVFRFFVENPMLDTVHIGPIIDYIWNQKYEDRIVFVGRGVAQEVGPAQPNFTMRGRTVDALLRAVNAWHRQLGKETKSGNLQWVASGIKEFSFIEGSKETKNMKVWRIKELLNSQELIAEGRQMSHCVATYAQSCNTGKCSIWSLSLETEEGMAKLLTIEVSNSSKAIKQIRGKRNRLAANNEKAIIRRWASREEIELAKYLV